MPTVDPWLPANLNGSTTIPAIPIAVYRIGDAGAVEKLPSLECLSIDEKEGPAPAVAKFRYRFGDNNPASPQRIEQAFSTGYSLPETVVPGDTLIVIATRPDGVKECLFHGHPVGFEPSLQGDGNREEGQILAAGVGHRLGDRPIGGMVLRDSNNPFDTTVIGNIPTDLPAVFNPKGLPNCSPDGYNLKPFGKDADDRSVPVFLDVLGPEKGPDPKDPDTTISYRTFWTLDKVARLLILYYNASEQWVKNPKGSDLDSLLVAIEPKDPDGSGNPPPAVDPADPDTYQAKPIVVPNTPISGRDWLHALHAQIADKGFAMALRPEITGLGTDAANVETRLDIYRTQLGPLKDLLLQPVGSQLDLTRSNVGSMDLTRDVAEAPNRWVVNGGPIRIEASFVLAPGFPTLIDDAASGTSGLKRFDTSVIDSDPTDRDKYRLYVFDETGRGHWAYGDGATKITDKTSLDAILGAPDPLPDGSPGSIPKYATRNRPALADLISKNTDGRPLKAKLSYSTDYTGPSPAVWDSSATGTAAGTWKPIEGGYQLLKDRLGIWVGIKHPNAWHIGSDPDAPSGPKVLNGVEAQANPTTNNPRFFLRLTGAIESDLTVGATAERRDGAVLPYDVTRYVDARDRYIGELVAPHSEFNTTDAPVPGRDDSDKATAEATALRDASDAGVLDGPVTIPRLTAFYEIGDRIREIDGRNLGLRTDAGTGIPVYPSIIARHFDFHAQTVTLTLSDAVATRKSYRQAPTRRPTRHG